METRRRNDPNSSRDHFDPPWRTMRAASVRAPEPHLDGLYDGLSRLSSFSSNLGHRAVSFYGLPGQTPERPPRNTRLVDFLDEQRDSHGDFGQTGQHRHQAPNAHVTWIDFRLPDRYLGIVRPSPARRCPLHARSSPSPLDPQCT